MRAPLRVAAALLTGVAAALLTGVAAVAPAASAASATGTTLASETVHYDTYRSEGECAYYANLAHQVGYPAWCGVFMVDGVQYFPLYIEVP